MKTKKTIKKLKQNSLYVSKILESYGEVILELRKENNEFKNRIKNLEKIPSVKNEIPKKKRYTRKNK